MDLKAVLFHQPGFPALIPSAVKVKETKNKLSRLSQAKDSALKKDFSGSPTAQLSSPSIEIPAGVYELGARAKFPEDPAIFFNRRCDGNFQECEFYRINTSKQPGFASFSQKLAIKAFHKSKASHALRGFHRWT